MILWVSMKVDRVEGRRRRRRKLTVGKMVSSFGFGDVVMQDVMVIKGLDR